jgi:hypothetical protein
VSLVILLVCEEVVDSRLQELQSNLRVHFTLTSASLHGSSIHCLWKVTFHIVSEMILSLQLYDTSKLIWNCLCISYIPHGFVKWNVELHLSFHDWRIGLLHTFDCKVFQWWALYRKNIHFNHCMYTLSWSLFLNVYENSGSS